MIGKAVTPIAAKIHGSKGKEGEMKEEIGEVVVVIRVVVVSSSRVGGDDARLVSSPGESGVV